MPQHLIHMSDEVEAIYLQAANKLGVPLEVEDTAERIAIALDIIAYSIDASNDVPEDLDVDDLDIPDSSANDTAVHLENVLNPNISTTYIPPEDVPAQDNWKPWSELAKDLYKEGDTPETDPVRQKAMEIVFNNFPKDEWATERCEKLIDATYKSLKKSPIPLIGGVQYESNP